MKTGIAAPLAGVVALGVFLLQPVGSGQRTQRGPLLPAPGPAPPAAFHDGDELEVDRNDPDCSDEDGDPYCTIGAALADAEPGDVIRVAPGVYPENLVIDVAGIRLVARHEDDDEHAEDPDDDDDDQAPGDDDDDDAPVVIDGQGGDVVTIRADGVELDGLVLQNGAIGVLVDGADDVELEELLVRDCVAGAVLRSADRTDVDRSRFVDNDQDGVVIEEGSDDNRIEDSRAENNGGNGFTIAGDRNVLERNRSTSNLDGYFLAGDDNRLEENEAQTSRDDGFEVQGDRNTLQRNVALSSGPLFALAAPTEGTTLQPGRSGPGLWRGPGAGPGQAPSIRPEAPAGARPRPDAGRPDAPLRGPSAPRPEEPDLPRPELDDPSAVGPSRPAGRSPVAGGSGSGFENFGADNVFEDNLSAGSSFGGILIQGRGNAHLEDNEVSEDRSPVLGGIVLFSPASSVVDNDSMNNVADGYLTSAGMNVLRENSAERNGRFGFVDTTTGGTGDLGTDNRYENNRCADNAAGRSLPDGLCEDSGP